jgi:hypothetical protein
MHRMGQQPEGGQHLHRRPGGVGEQQQGGRRASLPGPAPVSVSVSGAGVAMRAPVGRG